VNGGILNAFGGVHLNDYLSLQGNYTWNRNDLELFVIRNPGDSYEQRRDSSQHAAGVDLLLYFRARRSWVRPFLSAGPAVVRFTCNSTTESFSSVTPSLRVAVGIDARIAPGWAFRYSFLGAMQVNPISPHLSPPGGRRLANFQNLFGILRLFGK